MPCQSHSAETAAMICHGRKVLNETIRATDKSRIVITIPCDSTDAWIVASYDDFADIEKIKDPWRSVISKGKYYHGVRVRGDKKSIHTYSIFAEHLGNNWDMVIDKCVSAKQLDEEIRSLLIV